jgi:type II secretion system (T2SS) protein G
LAAPVDQQSSGHDVLGETSKAGHSEVRMRSHRNSWTLGAAVAVSLTIASAGNARAADGIRPEVLETLLRMRILAAVLDTQAVESSYPATAGLVPVSSLDERIASRARSRGGAVRDAWNNPLLYWSDGRSYLILSLGSDGARQFDYGATPPYANIMKGWAGSDPTSDLLIVDGVVYRGPASQSELLRRAMAEIRSAGTACESFAVDNNVYPGPVQPIDVLARIETDIEPIYIRALPTIDPWGNPYRFWSDTTHYALVSYGVDGVPDFPYESWSRAEFEALHTGPTSRFGQDLVLVNWQFVQWPAIVQAP